MNEEKKCFKNKKKFFCGGEIYALDFGTDFIAIGKTKQRKKERKTLSIVFRNQ